MTKIVLLEQLKAFTAGVIGDLILPVAQQRGDSEPPPPRAAEVFLTRLPDSKAATKKAPYVLHQIVTGKDTQVPGEAGTAVATVRTIICVYHPDEQQGGLALLNLMERLRISILEEGIIGKQFLFDRTIGLESLVYPEDTAPYYAGEMISVWKLPIIERKVPYGQEHNWNGAGLR
ncbi:hypothetical protein D1159_16155 [Pseudoflavonifractor sp. 524-17]|uniref:hypothetical protein n=1 Tax=Pseudoflavonifractor sp. 524-17 TaxID=2304577 RepID=UPI0013796BD1|nr:hypothetical protein [Pseudoflavonifractor sp. 524-17]NCE66070.1 hypothetical protein [Pseudoflavonifractor sp. 524-17]